MAKKIRQPESKRLLERLIALFLRAETDIINEIARLRAQRLIDYHTVAALERVQAILNELQTESWEYVPKMIEQTFYERVPEAYRLLQPQEKHQAGYYNARVLTSTQHAVVDVLVGNLMGEIVDACNTVDTTLRDAIIGPQQPGAIRNIALEISAGMQAGDPRAGLPAFVDRLRREGIRAFTDRAGRDWSLHTYGSMVLRTTNRQAEVMAVLTADDAHDLYQISSHGTTCKLCAPYEGRVYSKSGNEPDPGEGFFSSRSGNYLRGTIIGHGNVPVKHCLHLLKAAGFDGTISIEFEGMEPCVDAVRIGLANLKKYWSEV